MNSVGGFHEGEIDGKPFLIFTFLSQTDIFSSSGEAAIDSGSEDLLLQPLFSCPISRLRAAELNIFKNGSSLFNTPPHFFSKISQQLLDSYGDDDICKLPVLPLFWCNNKDDVEFCCGICETRELGTDYYVCETCERKFHKECVESPLQIKHPFYPFLSLQLVVPFRKLSGCVCCETTINNIVYQCPTTSFYMDTVCAMKPIPIVIDHPKRHPHPLSFFPKQAFLPCNVCGLVKEHIPTYICVRCVFVVHRDCVYFPHVVRICRHHHRISFISSLPSGQLTCGVCRQKIDNNYGAYSCNSCTDYFVHTKCALRRDVWDGKDLEGVPEESETDVESYVRIADGIILHFSHPHNLKLEISRVYDDDKLCQACVLPIYEGKYYACMDECEYILHETCATALRKKHHALHPHQLTLKVVNNGFTCCSGCRRFSCGLMYEDPLNQWGFKLDIRCASISEPFEYEGHEHPLFLALKPGEEERSAICQICQEVGDNINHCRKLNCIECDYVICFRCATIPYKARYKHDKHLLTFRVGKKESDESDWCDVCERKVVYSKKGGFYSCHDCCTVLHIDCLLGKDPYMKPGQTIDIYYRLQTDRNNTMSRPFCDSCKQRCPYIIVFKSKNKTFCTLLCWNCRSYEEM